EVPAVSLVGRAETAHEILALEHDRPHPDAREVPGRRQAAQPATEDHEGTANGWHPGLSTNVGRLPSSAKREKGNLGLRRLTSANENHIQQSVTKLQHFEHSHSELTKITLEVRQLVHAEPSTEHPPSRIRRQLATQLETFCEE